MEDEKPINKSEEYWTENLVPIEANHNQTKNSDQQENLYKIQSNKINKINKINKNDQIKHTKKQTPNINIKSKTNY